MRAVVLAAIILISVLVAITAAAIAWRLRTMRLDRTPPDVIYLGYDNQDNVDSLRTTMLDKLSRGELEQPAGEHASD